MYWPWVWIVLPPPQSLCSVTTCALTEHLIPYIGIPHNVAFDQRVHLTAKAVTHIHETYWASPHSSVGKESTCNAGDPSSILGSGIFPEEEIGHPLQYSWASLVAQLLSSHLQCRRPGFDPWVWKIPWQREVLPTPVFWPGEFQGLYSPWGHKESDTTEQLFYSSYITGLIVYYIIQKLLFWQNGTMIHWRNSPSIWIKTSKLGLPWWPDG